MKTIKFCLLIGILSVSTTVLAEWKSIHTNEKATTYVETTKIKRVNNLVTVWVLDDLALPEKTGNKSYKSTKSNDIYDCKNERTKTEYIVAYSDQMGFGDVVGSADYSSKSEWKPVIPGTVREVFFNKICQP